MLPILSSFIACYKLAGHVVGHDDVTGYISHCLHSLTVDCGEGMESRPSRVLVAGSLRGRSGTVIWPISQCMVAFDCGSQASAVNSSAAFNYLRLPFVCRFTRSIIKSIAKMNGYINIRSSGVTWSSHRSVKWPMRLQWTLSILPPSQHIS